MRSRSPAAGRYLAVDLSGIDLARGGRQVLRDLSWRIRPGQHWVLQGANGSGKTQLLKLIAGDVWPQPRPQARRAYAWRGERFLEPVGVKEEIAYVGAERQDRYEHYSWNHRVSTVVGTGLARSDLPLRALSARERQTVAGALRRLNIAALAQRRFLTLSHGERRLVLLARALVWRPALLLLDEPLNGLDATHRGVVLRALSQLRRTALPWIYATHRLEELPVGVTHRALLAGGRLRTGRWRLKIAAARTTALAARARRSTPAPMPLIELRNAWVWRAGVAVLRALSIRINAGECWVVHGDNGSGKSTLLGLLHGDFGVGSQGEIRRRGAPAGTPLSAFQRHTGLIAPELQSALPRRLAALDTVVAGWRGTYGLDAAPNAAERLQARQGLRWVGAARLAERSLADLSYGQARRVLFARALVRHPDILLLDEPYTGLDAHTRTRLMALTNQYADAHRTIVIATHHRDEWPPRTTHELELAGGGVRYGGPVRRGLRR